LKQLVLRPHMLLGGMFLFFPYYLLYAFNTPNAEEALFAVEKKNVLRVISACFFLRT